MMAVEDGGQAEGNEARKEEIKTDCEWLQGTAGRRTSAVLRLLVLCCYLVLRVLHGLAGKDGGQAKGNEARKKQE